ncbi:MAG TPA: F0F1 ATP synthase subunit B [Chloroflexota bacterium]|nr:F0F1 ATP synthase subunit B [Chloroflexota bacterium]
MDILNSLGINITAVVWHTVNFLILLWVLQRFLYRPVLNMLDQRAARIRDSMAQAESVRAETARLEQESRSILDTARRESQEILAQANRNSERILSESRQAAQQEAEHIVERARADLARERDQAFQELRQQIADLAVLAAGHVVRRSLDDAAHRELIQQFLATAGDGNARQG